MSASLPTALAFVDTETTGLNPQRHRVIELGIIRIENGREVARVDTLINPHSHLPPEIYALTGISYDELLRAPDFNDIQNEVREILDGAVFVAHNARFDYAFLKHEFTRQDSEFRAKVMCTVKLTRKLFPTLPRYSLSSIIEHFGFVPSARHRAFADAEVLWELFQNAVKTHGEEKVAEAINTILKTPSLPSNLPRELVEKLPEGPGVYTFFGDGNLPLYVGKSVNIKDRVKSHFAGDHSSTTDLTMSSQIKRIDTISTAGEVGALIRESDAIKALMPVYNRQLRRRHDLIVALKHDYDGFSRISIENLENIDSSDHPNIMAVYKSKKQAKESLHALSSEYNLCHKFLGLEKGKGACFASQIGICSGACRGDEMPKDYNLRFEEAFSNTRIKQWPFASAIVLKEQSTSSSEMHIIDKWCYLGSVVWSEETVEPKVEKYTPRFDWDIYKILAKAVLKGKNIAPIPAEVEAMIN